MARWPGSTHDSTIFNNSRIKANFEEGAYDDGLLLGDAGYASLPFLMVPLPDPRTAPEVLYNESQIRSRGHIERLFGLLALQWGVISNGFRLRNLQNTFTMIVAVAVLHNILRKKKIQRIGKIIGNVEEYINIIHNSFEIIPGQEVRQQIVDNHFGRFMLQI